MENYIIGGLVLLAFIMCVAFGFVIGIRITENSNVEIYKDFIFLRIEGNKYQIYYEDMILLEKQESK
jgi:hypothetical protein